MPEPEEPSKNNNKVYTRYMGMAFQMFAFLALGYVIGAYFDRRLEHENMVLGALLAGAFLILYLIKIVIDLTK